VDVTTATPADIDTRLVELEYRSARVAGTTRSAEAEAGTLAALREQGRKLSAEFVKLNAEYARRGGWPRVWLVPGGHAHRSRSCHSLFADTTLVLAPRDIRKNDMSGATEEEIVAAAGDRACTHCYPSAPVEPGPSSLRTRSEEEEAQARAEREAKRQAAAEKKAAKAIANPDGSRIKRDGWTINTEAEARRIYVQTHADAAWDAYRFGAARHAEKQAEVEHLLVAIAAKNGRDVDEMRAELAPKIAAKAKSDKRKATAHAKALGLPLN
jgi:hypothetical protein